MLSRSNSSVWIFASACVLLLTACGDPVLNASDASIERMFRHNEDRLAKLVHMAEQDKVEVLWLVTHENQPSDTVLEDERWQAYDSLTHSTGVRTLHRTNDGVEMGLDFASDDFMHDGVIKGLLYSKSAPHPVLPSLDDGFPDDVLKSGSHTAYKALAPNWYIFVRHE